MMFANPGSLLYMVGTRLSRPSDSALRGPVALPARMTYAVEQAGFCRARDGAPEGHARTGREPGVVRMPVAVGRGSA